ncbi:MAG: hypothetical protein CL828_00270 [Crocinitomicaceae bacterium]|nr:hypothetical protein [Crocinitomicaceae bacterium]
MAYMFLVLASAVQGQLDSLTWNATAWGQYRSNALSHELGRLLFRGGHIDRSLVDSAQEAQGGEMGAFGYTSGLAINWSSLRPWRDKEARLCGSLQLKTLGDFRWTPELFDLVLSGNSGHLGRWDVLDGSRMRMSTWIQVAVGLEGANQNRIELGLVHRTQSMEALIRNGYFYVSEGLDYMTGYLRGHIGSSEVGSWGLVTNAEWHFLREEAPFAFHLRLNNFGFVVAPDWTELHVDTLVETTGLTWTGPGLSVESLMQSEGVSEVISESNQRFRLDMMPFRIDASFEYPLGPRSGWDVQVQVGDWMPTPRAIAGYRRAIGKQWQAGIQIVVGGWGRPRPAAWARWKKPGEHALMLFLEDPFGWGSKAAYGRGITLRYQNL